MLIRYKLLLLLLGIALLPLIIMSWRGYHITHNLGIELADQSRDELTTRTTEQLQQAITYNTTILDRTKGLLENALRLQAREVENRIGKEPTHSKPIYLTKQFTGALSETLGIKPSKKYLRLGPDNKLRPMPVSEDVQNYLLAPGVSQEAVAKDMAQLSTMTDVYKAAYQRHGELILWLYSALDSGVHTAFPGHGFYPENFDPRIRPWYTSARDSDDIVWSSATIDAVTRRAVMTLTMPFRDPDGKFAGVTAIDIPVLDMLENTRMWATPSKQSKSFVADFVRRPGSKTGSKTDDQSFGPRIFARQNFTSHSWNAVLDLGWLESKETKTYQKMLADMKSGTAGIRRMPYQGKDSLWAYGRFATPFTFLVVIVPYTDITKQARQTEKFVRSKITKLHQTATWISGGIIILVLLLAFYSSRTVTEPARRLAAAARKLADGDFSTRVEVTTDDELGQLAESFNEAVPQLEDRMKVRQALALAMDVQQNLLPKEAPRVEGYEIAGKSVYCDETGGDYYDFIDLSKLGNGRIGIAVGDISGHGFAAALLMTTVRALLRSRATRSNSLQELMNDINRHLARDTQGGRFMTLFYLIIDQGQPALRWINAGHDPALVFDCASGTFDELSGRGIPIGIEDSWDYEENTQTQLDSGSIVIIGTDGIWETRNPAGEMYGKDVLKALIKENSAKTATEICDLVHDTLTMFRGDGPQADDITLVVIKKDPGACAA